MTTTERRRNQYPGSCYVCRKSVDAGAGWLYCDTKSDRSRSRHRTSGSWAKRVKCDRCHQANISSKWQADNLDNPKPAAPRSRPWSVAQVKDWVVCQGVQDGDVALFLVGRFGEQKISYRHRTTGKFTAPTGYALEEFLEVNGRHLSKAAAEELSPRIRAAIIKIQDEETRATKSIVGKLLSAGAVLTSGLREDFFALQFAGGTYWVTCGRVQGRHSDSDTWDFTTVEEIITRTKKESSR